MNGAIYLLRTPVREVGALAYGGPLRLRTPQGAAYAGFRTVELAQFVADFWGIAGEHDVEPWQHAVHHEVPGACVRQIVVFEDRDDFERFLQAREHFDFAHHTVCMHPAMVARSSPNPLSPQPDRFSPPVRS